MIYSFIKWQNGSKKNSIISKMDVDPKTKNVCTLRTGSSGARRTFDKMELISKVNLKKKKSPHLLKHY